MAVSNKTLCVYTKKEKIECPINVIFPHLPSGGIFVSRLEHNTISKQSMPEKAKFYLTLIKLLV